MSELPDADCALVAERLMALYEQPFGGKARGRYRISVKHLRALTGRRRLYPDDIAAIGRAVYELGYVLIDLESFFVVLNQRTFASHRRVNDGSIDRPSDGVEDPPASHQRRRRGAQGGRPGA